MKLTVVVLLVILMQGIQAQSEDTASVDCGHPGNVINGKVDVSKGTKLHAFVWTTCDEGFIRNGSWLRICGSDGRWTGTTPTCEVPKTCPQPDIEHGSVEVSQSYNWYYARYTCNVGFEMRGGLQRDCNLLTGEWDGTAPTCEESNVDCGHPGNIQYGTVNVSEGTKLRARIYYTCDRGYRLYGPSSRTCSSHGAWSGREPTCQACGHPGNITNGKVILDNGTKIGSIVYYKCDEGYGLSGRSYRTCRQYGAYGAWTGWEPSCVVDCGHPGNITNGTVHVYGTTLEKRIHYRCDVGYILNGSSRRRCQSNGTWSGLKPTCEAIKRCPNPGDIDHGSVRVVDSIRYYNELHARYSCDRGHALRGQSRRNCDLFTGQWEGPAPMCEEVECGHPGNVTNGTVDVSEGTKLHATARYTCDEGFIRNGSRSRTCGSDGRWSGTTPTCEVIKTCPQPDIEHGSVKVIRSFIRVFNQYYARYTCDAGYEMRGWSGRSCDVFTGEWDRTAPTCEESNVDCGHPGNIQYGTVNVSEGTKIHARIHYTCDRGYILNGPSSRTCSSFGAWSGREPTCEEIDCGHPGNITNGKVIQDNGTKIGSTVYYKCDEGYVLRGVSYRTCGQYGWSGREPYCVVDCGHPGNITNGTVHVYESILGKSIRYSCDEGYILYGSSLRTCQSNGTWSGLKPTCKAMKRCPNPEDINHGRVIVNIDRYSRQLYAWYSCDRGHALRGQSGRYCDLLTGEWEGTAPTCEKSNVDCGHPGNIQYGKVNVSEGTKLHARIYYTCDRGYILNGPSYRMCSSHGTWSGREPTCEECGHPGNIRNGKAILDNRTKIDSIVYYMCDEGYRLNGPSYRTCGQRGWIGWAPFCVLDCGHPKNIANGTVTVHEYEHTHNIWIRYRCDVGYIRNGSYWRRCQSNGTWSGLKPTCEVIKRCPNPEDIDHGSARVVDSIRYFRQLYARYSCDIGHALRGQSRRNCDLFTGEWEGPAPTCEESSVDCGHPGNVTNGTVDVSEGTNPRATAQYTCDEGFIRNGSRSRTCRSDGRWSGTTPTCEVLKICPQPEVEHGSVKVTQSFTSYYARYTCNVGYEMRGWWHRDCNLLTGEWDRTAPTCEESNVDCRHPGNIQYGTVNVSEGTKLHARVYYTCDRGYRLYGMRSNRICLPEGWSGVEPTCAVAVCGHPGNITNGEVTFYGAIAIGLGIIYSCDDGYILNGISTRLCLISGSWSGSEPICEAIKRCPNPEDIDHGSVRVIDSIRSYDELYAWYSCDRGYALRGQSRRNCDLFAGEWEEQAPSCEANVDCGHPGNIQNGTVDVSGGTKVDATVQYTCDEGFSRNGSSTRTCQSDGRWSETTPTCEAIDCGHPGEITNGRVDVSRGTKPGAKVRYSCNRGYKLKGPAKRKCKKTGLWNKRAPTCRKRN